MTNLLKSIRREMKRYGPRLRSGHYGVAGYTTGVIPSDYQTIHSVHCDVESGVVTDIRLYPVGAAMEPCDYYDKSINITHPVEEYLRGNLDWAEMLSAIEAVVKEHAE